MKPPCSQPFPCGLAWPTPSHADQTITQLAADDHQTDWGMRIISAALESLRRFWISLRFGVAAVHGMGFRRRIPLSSRLPRLLEPAFERACSVRTARSDTSRKSCRVITTNRSLPVRHTRSGLPRWSSVRFCAACLVCRRMRKNARSRWLRTFPRIGPRLRFTTSASGSRRRLPISQDSRQRRARGQAQWNRAVLGGILSGLQPAHADRRSPVQRAAFALQGCNPIVTISTYTCDSR